MVMETAAANEVSGIILLLSFRQRRQLRERSSKDVLDEYILCASFFALHVNFQKAQQACFYYRIIAWDFLLHFCFPFVLLAQALLELGRNRISQSALAEF